MGVGAAAETDLGGCPKNTPSAMSLRVVGHLLERSSVVLVRGCSGGGAVVSIWHGPAANVVSGPHKRRSGPEMPGRGGSGVQLTQCGERRLEGDAALGREARRAAAVIAVGTAGVHQLHLLDLRGESPLIASHWFFVASPCRWS